MVRGEPSEGPCGPAEDRQARLLGRILVACFDEAMARWLVGARPRRCLAAELEATFDELRAFATSIA